MYQQIEHILRCPITNEELNYVADTAAETDMPRTGGVTADFSTGFLNQSRSVFYPVIDNIICLMPEYALSDRKVRSNEDVLKVQEFYNRFGWTKSADGKYQDNKLFIDQRNNVGDNYKLATFNRINRLLERGGDYLLDIASGPAYQEHYKAFGAKFKTRICCDISIEALREAQKNLADYNALFVIGDITNIPLKDGVCDSVISMHTLYHVPKGKQAEATHELVRVAKSGSDRVVISYNWGWHSLLMNVALFPSRLLRLVKRIQKIVAPSTVDKESMSALYFYSHSPAFFRRHQPPKSSMRFTALRSLHENFIMQYLSDGPRSERFLNWLTRKEDKHPEFFGRQGAFGLIVYDKL